MNEEPLEDGLGDGLEAGLDERVGVTASDLPPERVGVGTGAGDETGLDERVGVTASDLPLERVGVEVGLLGDSKRLLSVLCGELLDGVFLASRELVEFGLSL